MLGEDGHGDDRNDDGDDDGSRPALDFTFQALYQPFILPFVVVSLASLVLHREELERRHGGKPLKDLVARPFAAA